MAIASGMKELTQDIASSHEDRTKRLAEIKDEAKNAGAEAQDLVRGFQTSRKEAGTELRRSLAQDEAQRQSQTIGLIRGFQTSREGMGSELRKELAQSRANVKSEVGQLLKDFKESHKEMGSKLRKGLTQSRADRESEVKEMQGDFRKAQAEVRAEMKEAAAAWGGLASTIQTKEAWARMPAKEEKTEVPDLEQKLLALVQEHPGGIALAQAAEKVGVATIALGRAAHSLLDKAKIRKEAKLYFPVES